MEYWLVNDFCKDSNNFNFLILNTIFCKFSNFYLVKYIGQIESSRPQENILFLPGSNIDLFSREVPNDLDLVHQNSYALISAYSTFNSSGKLSHLFTARFDQYKIFTQARCLQNDGLIYCNALDSIVVLNFTV